MTFIIHPHVRNPAYIHIPNESTQQLRVCLKSLQLIATLVQGRMSESILSHDGKYGRLRTIVSTYM